LTGCHRVFTNVISGLLRNWVA